MQSEPSMFLAEYDSPNAIAKAAMAVRDAGYTKWDCHTPYPLHGLDQAMGLKPTKIGVISFTCGMIGIASAIALIQFANHFDYPLIVGGKPTDFWGAFPSMGPIMFELGILFTGFGTLFGLLSLLKLPRHNHPIFESERFDRSTDDKFFISIEAGDTKFSLDATKRLLESTNPTYLELLREAL